MPILVASVAGSSAGVIVHVGDEAVVLAKQLGCTGRKDHRVHAGGPGAEPTARRWAVSCGGVDDHVMDDATVLRQDLDGADPAVFVEAGLLDEIAKDVGPAGR